MKACRSFLYVPGDRPAMFDKAVRSRADAIVIDFEDAVVPAHKAAARDAVRAWHGGGPRPCEAYVRINGPDAERGLVYADLELAAELALAGIFVPKIQSVPEVQALDHVLAYLEHKAGLAPGHIELGLIMETAAAIEICGVLARAAPRVASIVCGGGRDGDTARSLGYRWTATGEETLYMRSKVLLAARAAGIRFPIYSGWMDVRDLAGLAGDAQRASGLGYTGQMVIHPSHVPVCNAAYGLGESELAYYRKVVELFAEAERMGRAAIEIDGNMVDLAMARTAADTLRRFGYAE